MNAACSSQSGTLAGDVAIWGNSCPDQPLSEPGIEASGNRILSRAGGDEPPNLEVCVATVFFGIPRRHDAYGLAGEGREVGTKRKDLRPASEHDGDPAWSVVDPLRGLDGCGLDPQPSRQPGEQIRSDGAAAAQGRSRKSEAVPIAFDPHETHPALLHDMVALG